MNKLLKLELKKILFALILLSTLLPAQNNKLGGKISIGVIPLTFGVGLNYLYNISNIFALRSNLDANINFHSESIKLYGSDNIYIVNIGCQGLIKPLNTSKAFYLGVGIGYYIITGDNAAGNAPDIGDGWVVSEEISNSIGFDLIAGVTPTDFLAIEFNYLLLFPNQILTISDWNTNELSKKEQTLNLSSIRLNFIFAFSL